MNEDLYGLQASGIDPEIAAKMLGTKRKRKVTEAMVEQAMTPINPNRVAAGGLAVPISPWEGLAQVAKMYFGNRRLDEADKELAGLASENQKKVAEAMAGYEKTRMGDPGVQMPTAVDDEGNSNAPNEVAPVKGDPRRAIAEAMASPLLQKNPIVSMDAKAYEQSMQPRVLGRTLVDGTGKTIATDSTWAEEQRNTQQARAEQSKAALEARAAEAQANRDAAMERQRQSAEDRAFQIRLAASFRPNAGQPTLTKGQEAADREFGKEYAQYQAAGGSADVEKQLTQLEQVSKGLGNKDNNYTGSVRGLLPDKIRAITNPDAIAAKNKVEEVAQRNLRLVLGAQFTQVEGEKLIARTYNDQMKPEENKRRVDALAKQIRVAAQTKEDAARYFEKNGTLAGWKGRMPTLADFESAIDNAGSNSSTGAIQKQAVPADIGDLLNKYGKPRGQ